jgi:hypothetical protein
MFRCPRCNSELPETARFCNKCGFNQTNARMMAMASAQQGESPAGPHNAMQPAPQQPAPPGSRAQQAPGGANYAGPSGTPPGAVQPIRTNTPPKSKDSGGPITPAPAAPRTAPPPAQSVAGNEAAPAKGLSLTKRYISEQETRHQPVHQAPVKAAPLPNTPGVPGLPPKPQAEQKQQRQPEQVIRTSTPPPAVDLPTAHFPITAGSPPPPARPAAGPQPSQSARGPKQADLPTGRFPLTAAGPPPSAKESRLWDENDTLLDDESFSQTSEEAERWRNNWRDRQRAEAGPAIDVSRGQASVPEPLMAMQHSLARMRAVLLTRNEEEDREGMNLGFWVIVGLLICLILGVSAYIISTYISGAQPSSQISPLNVTLLSMFLE